MRNITLKAAVALLAAASSLLAAGTASASLIGKTVNFSTLYPNASTVFLNDGNRVVGAGIEYPAGFSTYSSVLQVDVAATQVFFTLTSTTSFSTTSFNGYQLTLLGGDTFSATLNTALTTLAPVSFAVVGGNVLQVNMSGLYREGPSATVFDLQVTDGTTVVPVPGALVLALSGLGMLGATLRRSRR